MEENELTQSEEPMSACKKMMGGGDPTSDCPMSAVFKRVGERPVYGLLSMIPGLALVAVGVLVLVEPKILAWIMGGASILLGVVGLITTVAYSRGAMLASDDSRQWLPG